jgi:regulator of protease activity HflC (stomatin/prohibitin superfamily)
MEDPLMFFDLTFYFAIGVIVLLFLSAAIKILREYVRGVVFTLGRSSASPRLVDCIAATGRPPTSTV